MNEVEPVIVASRARDPLEPSRRGPCAGRMFQKLERNVGGCSNCISSVSKDNYLVLPAVLKGQRTAFGRAVRKQYDHHEIYLKRQEMREWVPKTDGTNNTISSVTKDNVLMETKNKETKKRKHSIPSEMLHLDNLPEELKGKKVYIRKLTPRECFRLMDVSEENIDKIVLPRDEKGKPVISNSAQYKLAGNSIVVSCMELLFRNLVLESNNRNPNGVSGQLSLFPGIYF